MAAIITEKFSLHNAAQFFESFSETAPNVYYMLFGTGGASISDWPTQVTTTGVLGSAGKPGYVYIVNY